MDASELVEHGWRGLNGRLALAEATSLALAGDHEAAGAQYERAIEVFRRYQLPWDEAEAFLSGAGRSVISIRGRGQQSWRLQPASIGGVGQELPGLPG